MPDLNTLSYIKGDSDQLNVEMYELFGTSTTEKVNTEMNVKRSNVRPLPVARKKHKLEEDAAGHLRTPTADSRS